ncbi:MAG: MFS transporter [Succinivibrio sp.]|nr:MFS transporter [Succinivibrio sp.]
MKQSSTNNHTKYQVYIYILTVAVMCTIFGFNLGALISTKLRLVNIFMLEIYDIDSMINTFLLGAFVGSFLCGRLIAQTGRLQAILGAFIIGVLGHSTSAMSPTFSTLFISEFAVGAAFGIYLLASTCYVVELAPSSNRGMCSTLIGVFFCLGLLIAFLLRNIIAQSNIMVVSTVIVLCIPVLLYAYARLPESPRYLSLSESSDRALSVLIKLRNKNSEAARELAAINECVLGEDRGINLFFKSSVYRSVIWILLSTALLIFFQGCAIIPLMTSELCKIYNAAVGALLPHERYELNYILIGSIFVGILLASVFSSYLVDKIGHKAVMLGACMFNEVLLLFLFILLSLMNRQFGPYAFAFILLLFAFSSVILLNVFITTLLPELLPLKGREFGLSVCLITCYAAIMLCLYLFSRIMHNLGIQFMISFFVIIGAIQYVVLKVAIPETKDQMLEQMENTIFNERSLKAIDKKLIQ